MPVTVTPFLMFEGQAEEAIKLYVSVIPGSHIIGIQRYGSAGPGATGTVLRASASIGGQTVQFIDSPAKHAFTFTPSTSLFVNCDSEAELDAIGAALVAGGSYLMPPGAYGFSRKFAWLTDRFGVSWQLNCS